MDTKEEDFENQIQPIFEEFLASSYESFLFETKNREQVFNFFEQQIKSLEVENNANFFVNLKVFDIEKVRELINFSNINFSEKRFFIISFYSITHQAQNAFLKLLEEGKDNIKIVLIVHRGANLLETLVSRLYRLEILDEQIVSDSSEEEFLESLAENFLTTKPINRMKLEEVQDILKRKDEYALEFEDKERNDRESLEKFLLKLYNLLFEKYENFIKESKELEDKKEKEGQDSKSSLMFDYRNKEFLSDLENLAETIKYARNNSSSGKTLLEYLALKLPEFN